MQITNQPSGASLVHVPFHSDTIDCVRQDDAGEVLVSIKRVCENLGVDPKSQRRKLKAAGWAREVIMTSRDSEGRLQEMAFLPLDQVPMWLTTINASKVAVDVRPKLVAYQRECRDVLARHFGFARDGRDEVLGALQAIQARLENLEAARAPVARLPSPHDPATEEDLRAIRNVLVAIVATRHISFSKAQGILRIACGVGGYKQLRREHLDTARAVLLAEIEKGANDPDHEHYARIWKYMTRLGSN